MYLNRNNNTNIDNNNNNDFFYKYKFLVIISIGIIALVSIAIYFSLNKVTKNLTLNGEDTITIYINSDYIEPGFNAYNSKNKDLSNEVKITSNLNTKRQGTYEITYTLDNITKVRTINVIEKNNDFTYIYLKPVNNDINIYLKLGEKYIEPGFKVYSSSDENLANKVKINGSVDTTKKGIYKITYTLIDNNNITISKSRLVTVMDTEINLSLSTKEYTNNDVYINVNILDDLFDYLILPNNKQSTKSTYAYKISENGTYKFTTYNKKGISKEETINVTNIDKIKPTVSCSGSYKEGKSTINIMGNDNVAISKYVINGTEYTTQKTKIQKTLSNELKTVNVTIYDKAGNNNSVSCNLENKNNQNNQHIQIKSGRYSYYYHIKNKTVLTTMTEKWYFDNSGTILEMGFVIDIPDISLIKDLDKIPLIVKLHGGGGYNNESLLKSFIPNTRLGQEKIPAIVLYPCKTTSTNIAWKKYNEAVIGIIDWVIKEYHINENKISLAGFSRGGGGAWQIAAMNPDKFSSLVLIEPSMNGGGTVIDWFDNTTLSYPVWIFHGRTDQLGLRATTNRIYNKGCATNTKKKLTIDSKLVHSQVSLNILMDDYNLIDWMLERDKSKDKNYNFE